MVASPIRQPKSRVIILTGPNIWHKNTVATFLNSEVNVVGICYCNQNTGDLPLNYIWHSVRIRGLSKTLGQILGRVCYKLFNRKMDQKKLRKIFVESEIYKAIEAWTGPVHHTTNYSNEETMEWLKSLTPDIFVVHTGYWVAKKVRNLPRLKAVIGGHPGITPNYRGSHSAFWAIYNKEPKMVGCSVFWLDKGVDTGDLVIQESITPEPDDSYFSLGWRGMKRIAELQVRTIEEFDQGVEIPRIPHEKIPKGSEYPIPTLVEYVRYRSIQKQVR